MIATVRVGTLVGLLVFCVACGGEPGSLTAPTPPARPSGPPLSGPSTAYHFSAPIDRPVHSYTLTSNYVLFNNGAFALLYAALGGGPYTGSYQREDGRILFDFGADGKSPTPGEPDAVGTLNGNLLEVRYNFWVRVGGDSEDAVYQRTE